jgi:hypothetical protein
LDRAADASLLRGHVDVRARERVHVDQAPPEGSREALPQELGDVALRPIADIEGVPELFDVLRIDELDVLPAKLAWCPGRGS